MVTPQPFFRCLPTAGEVWLYAAVTPPWSQSSAKLGANWISVNQLPRGLSWGASNFWTLNWMDW